MPTSAEHRHDALRCRRLSRDILDGKTKAALDALASEHEQAASELDRAAEAMSDDDGYRRQGAKRDLPSQE